MPQTTANSNRVPVLGCIADDVTGATDLAINLVQGGMRVVQLLGVPDTATLQQANGFDAVVVALKTRSISKSAAIKQSLAALTSLQHLNVSRFYFKYCSTFDSTEAGNIGPVAEAIMSQLGVDHTVFCPAFPKAHRTVYLGHLFVGDALLNESGMENHPLNPMRDANLVRFLGKQSTKPVGLFGYDNYTAAPRTFVDRLQSLASAGEKLIVTDVCSDDQLRQLANGVGGLPFVTGGSGLARYLPDAYRALGVLASETYVPVFPNAAGRALIVAGSCSKATNGQVAWMQGKCPVWPVDVAAVMADARSESEKILSWAAACDPADPLLLYTTAEPEQVKEVQNQFGRESVAFALESFLATVTKSLVALEDVRRLVIAGGETSGAVVKELGIRALTIGPEICVGVPWTEGLANEATLALALKSGNFGEPDFFQTALEVLP